MSLFFVIIQSLAAFLQGLVSMFQRLPTMPSEIVRAALQLLPGISPAMAYLGWP